MLTNYLIICLLWAICARGSVALKDHNSGADVAALEAKRIAKSEHIRKYMNESIDPCEDFYQFACGNWRTHHPATTNNLQTMEFYLALDEFNRIILAHLNKTDDQYTESERKVKQFYDSCVLDKSDYTQNIKKLIKEFGRMPALEGKKWQEKEFDWIETIGKISYKYGIQIIYGHIIFRYPFDATTKFIAMKSYVEFEFPDTSAKSVNDKILEVENNLKQLTGLKVKTAKQAAKEIVNFALNLWRAKEKDSEEDKTTFEEMHEKFSHSLDLLKLVKTSFGFVPDGPVFNIASSYVDTLGTIMKKTPKRIVANYIFYILMTTFNFQQSCLELTKTHFMPILNHLVYRTSNLNETEQEFHHMWQGITATFRNNLESSQLSWFDDDSREAALEKLHLMKLYIGSFEDINFDDQYKELTLNRRNFMENKKSVMSFTAKQTRKSLNERHDSKYVAISPLSPSYFESANTVRFPMTSLVTDFMWSKYVPQAINYGRLGTIVGHEIMHGFSGSGITYNKLGNAIDSIFKNIEEGYDERRQCYYDQYHNYTLDKKPLPQDKVQGENLADNGGIFLGYHAYMSWLENDARTQHELDMETLPHLNYSNKQLFFIGYSQTWCADTLPSIRFRWALIDNHSPPEFRGFVPLLNFGEFSKAFNCPSGSPMNPRKKCSIY